MFKSIDYKRFFISLFLISTFIGVTLVNIDSASNLFNSAQSFIANNFGWLIILSANGFLIFCIWMAISRFGAIRLGGTDAKPEFNFINWIAMLFSAGLGIGVLFYSVAEPVMHLSSSALFEEGVSFNERATLSMNLTFLHWGFHAWAIYGVVGLCFAYFAFNLGTLKEFPKFTQAVIDNNTTVMRAEYPRYSGGKLLTRRNNIFYNTFLK